MNTSDPYFHPGDEELQAWIHVTHKDAQKGYIRGRHSSETYPLGIVRDGLGWVSEENLQKMAESMMDEHIIFFVRVVSTCDV